MHTEIVVSVVENDVLERLEPLQAPLGVDSGGSGFEGVRAGPRTYIIYIYIYIHIMCACICTYVYISFICRFCVCLSAHASTTDPLPPLPPLPPRGP